MDLVTIVTLVGVAVAVGAVALYLILVAAALNHVSFTVGTVLIGVRAIANQTEPIGTVVSSILKDVNAINAALSGLVGEGALGESEESPYRRKAIRAATVNRGF